MPPENLNEKKSSQERERKENVPEDYDETKSREDQFKLAGKKVDEKAKES